MTATATDSFLDEVFSELKLFVAAEFQARFDAYARAMDDRFKALPVREVKGEPGKDGPTLEQVAQLVKAEVALIPRPKDGEPGKSIERADVALMVRDAVDGMPKPKDGVDGKSIEPQDVLAMVKSLVDAIPKPRDGMDGKPGERGADGAKGDPGEKGEAGQRGEKGDSGEPGKPGDRGEPGSKGDVGPIGEKGAPGLNGKDGAPGARGEQGEAGIAGKDGSPGLQGEKGLPGDPGLQGERGEAGIQGKDGAPGLNGKDGADGLHGKDGAPGERGVDGKSFTIEDARPILEAELAKWALDFERRAGDVLQKAIDRMPVPKDGRDGRDGVDGLGLDGMTVEKTSDRTVDLIFKSAAGEQRTTLFFPVALDAGVFKAGEAYEPGDCITYGGSLFIAQRATLPTEKPEDGTGAFRLAVKRGRDAT